MKRAIYFFATLAAVVMLTTSVPAFFPWSKDKKDEDVQRTGVVNFYNGEVILVSGKGESQAGVGDKVKEGMTVKTGSGSFVDIHFGLNVIKVLENSVVEISVLKSNVKDNSETTEFLVQDGKVLSRVGERLRRNDSYTIRTPTTIAGVRGTDFLLEELNNMTNIACIGGSVEVRGVEDPGRKSVSLQDGFEITVKDGFAGDVRKLSEENRKNIEKIFGEMREMREELREGLRKERDRFRKDVRKFGPGSEKDSETAPEKD